MHKLPQVHILCLIVFLLQVAVSPVVARSEPELLAEFGGGSGSGGSAPSYTDITHLSFGLLYNDSDSCVGCELLIPVGETGEFTFDASTSPGWADVAARMVNGIDEIISSIDIVHFGSETAVGGIGNFESNWFLGVPDFNGSQVDFIRLIVNNVTIGPDCCSEGGGYSIATDVTWQIWGTPAFLRVEVDVKPDSDLNPIKLHDPCKNDKLPVAVLSTPGFDAGNIDSETVLLGKRESRQRVAALRSTLKDVDDDGDDDLYLLFSVCELRTNGGLDEETTELALSGETTDDVRFIGSDFVTIVMGGR